MCDTITPIYIYIYTCIHLQGREGLTGGGGGIEEDEGGRGLKEGGGINFFPFKDDFDWLVELMVVVSLEERGGGSEVVILGRGDSVTGDVVMAVGVTVTLDCADDVT